MSLLHESPLSLFLKVAFQANVSVSQSSPHPSPPLPCPPLSSPPTDPQPSVFFPLLAPPKPWLRGGARAEAGTGPTGRRESGAQSVGTRPGRREGTARPRPAWRWDRQSPAPGAARPLSARSSDGHPHPAGLWEGGWEPGPPFSTPLAPLSCRAPACFAGGRGGGSCG